MCRVGDHWHSYGGVCNEYHGPNRATTEELARDACLAWADGDNDKMQIRLLGLFLHLYGRAPEVKSI